MATWNGKDAILEFPFCVDDRLTSNGFVDEAVLKRLPDQWPPQSETLNGLCEGD
jgi:hypothetical protein